MNIKTINYTKNVKTDLILNQTNKSKTEVSFRGLNVSKPTEIVKTIISAKFKKKLTDFINNSIKTINKSFIKMLEVDKLPIVEKPFITAEDQIDENAIKAAEAALKKVKYGSEEYYKIVKTLSEPKFIPGTNAYTIGHVDEIKKVTENANKKAASISKKHHHEESLPESAHDKTHFGSTDNHADTVHSLNIDEIDTFTTNTALAESIGQNVEIGSSALEKKLAIANALGIKTELMSNTMDTKIALANALNLKTDILSNSIEAKGAMAEALTAKTEVLSTITDIAEKKNAILDFLEIIFAAV